MRVTRPPTAASLLDRAASRAREGAPVEDLIATDPVAWVRHTHPKIDAKDAGYGLMEFDPWPHQEMLMREQFAGRSTVSDKSRQTGVTTALMVGMAHGVLYGYPWHGIAIAQSEDVALGVLLSIARLALETAELTPAQKSNLTMLGKRIEYRDQNRQNYIRAFTAAPNSTRSFGGNRVLMEEVAFMAYAAEIYKGIRPMLDDGDGSVALVSTYNGDGDFFCRCVDHAAEMGMRHVPIDWRSRPDRDENWKRRSQQGFDGLPEEWAEEHELQRITSGEALFNLPIIEAFAKENVDVCMRPDKHPVDDHVYLKGVDVAGKGRARTVCTAIDLSTDPPHVAVQEVDASSPFKQTQAFIRAFDERYPGRMVRGGSLFLDATGIGEAMAESLSDMQPPPIAVRFVGGSSRKARQHDKRTGLYWQHEPRDSMLSYTAQKAETGAVVVPEWFPELRMALKSARWNKSEGQFVDELDSFMLACIEVPVIGGRRRGKPGRFRGLPMTDRLREILQM